LIQFSPGSERLLKITHANQYGMLMRLVRSIASMPQQLSEVMGLRPATPLEYLDRLGLHNRLFGDDAEFLGLVRLRGGLSMVISQIFLHGRKPGIPLIRDFMAAHGFRKLRDENAYFRAEDKLAVFDAHARNFVFADGVPVPFDVIPQFVSGRLESLLGLWME